MVELCIGGNVIVVRRPVAPQINHKKTVTAASLLVAVSLLRGAMGDRVYAEVICRAEDAELFKDLGFPKVHEPFPTSMRWPTNPRQCVAVNAKGLVDKKQLQAVKRYWRAVVLARQKLGFVDEEM